MDIVLSAPVIICLIVGILLLIAEIFTPGIGVCGALGAIVLIAAAIIQARSFEEALLYIVIVLVIVGAIGFFLLRSVSKGRLAKSRIVLNDSVRDSGNDYSELLYRAGTAKTDLHPAGSAVIEGRLCDVVAESDFIESGAPVCVVAVDGMRIVVRRMEEER